MTEATRRILMIVCDLAIFFVTAACVLGGCITDRHWDREKTGKTFRFFTILSNVFCALASLAAALCLIGGRLPEAVRLVRYVSTAAVSVTMVTVLVFLGPNMGYLPLLSGSSLFLHLLTPLASIAVFAFLEEGTLTFAQSLLGLIPMTAYGILYCRKVVFEPEERKWDDFYGFNKGGHWRFSCAAMFAGTLILCVLLWALDKV